MSAPGNGSEPSMEEILASIRNMVSQEPGLKEKGPAAPVLPHPAPAQHGSNEFNGPGPAPTLPPSPGPSSGATQQMKPRQPAPAGRHDDDDLADLLDEPLPPAARPDVATPFLAGAQGPGAPSPANSAPGNASGSGAESLGFDFGSLIPRRDPEPRSGGENLPLPGAHRPLDAPRQTEFMSPPVAKTPNDTLSPGWPESMRSSSQANPLGESEVKSPPPSAGNSSAGFAGAGLEKSGAQQANPRAGDGPAAPEAPGRYFPGPSAESSPSEAGGKPAQAPRAEDQSVRAPAPASIGTAPPSPAPATEDESSTYPSFFNSRQTPSAKGGKSESKASTGFPSIEPVLKAFEKIDSKSADAGQSKVDGRKADAEKTDSVAKSAGLAARLGAPLVSVPAKEPPAKAVDSAEPRHDAPANRSLEETVMELLRPMLREWLDENLPRIIEDTVRREVADAVKTKNGPGSKA